ncbi:hypothetical protein [uncultured Selenomonas sp.]|uniref:hypothetical protein n=1 Tax=uncultured Selenomonas sp. TaxID=159275 RepID=UPI002675A12D|nr:hypothetical protein [uncultured Selenomonas sp.]
MATISFDREIRLRPEDMDRFLDAIKKPPKHKFVVYDIEKEMRESRRLLENAFHSVENPAKKDTDSDD